MNNGSSKIFRALYARNFRLFFIGQSISLTGTWMQQIAMSWLVYHMTSSPLLLGVVSFAGQIPTFIFSPFAGVMADRWELRRLVILAQAAAMVQAFILAFLTLTGMIQVWHIIFLSVILGFINAFDMPGRQAFLIEMVEEREMMGNAIALNSMMFNLARLIGPSIAGFLIAIIGEGMCFFINGFSFLAVILSLSAMEIKFTRSRRKESRVFKELKEGFFYAFGFTPIRDLLLLLGIISMVSSAYTVIMPIYARDILKGGPSTLGFLMAAIGIGALIGTLYLASREKSIRLGKIIPVSISIFSSALFMFSLSRSMWISCVFLALTGFGFMVHMASTNTIIQTLVDDDKRGRVMSFYVMSFMGAAPLGSILVGYFAHKIGSANTLIAGSVLCLSAAAVFAMRIPLLREKLKL